MKSRMNPTSGIVNRLAADFPLQPIPSQVIKPHDDHGSSLAVKEWLAGNTWDSVEHSLVERMRFDLSLLTPAAYVYYLPAFLKAAHAEPKGNCASDIQIMFSPFSFDSAPTAKKLDPQRIDRFKLLKQPQKKAVLESLEFVARTKSSPDLNRIIEWWRLFCK